MARRAWTTAETSRREGRGSSAPAAFRLRSHFRAMKVRISVSGRQPSRPAGGVGRMAITIMWSAQKRPIVVRAGGTLRGMPGVSSATMARWAQIEAGDMPESEDIEQPWTEEEAAAVAQDRADELYERQRDEEARVRRQLESRVEDAQTRIDYHTDQADRYDGQAAYYHRLEATRAEREQRQAHADADQQFEEIAERVREERREIINQVTRETERMQEEWDAHIQHLQSGLGEEIRSTLERDWSAHGAPIQAVEDWHF